MVRTTARRIARGLLLAALAAALAYPVLAQAQQPKFAVIDVQRLINDSAPGKAMVADLNAYGKEQESKLQGKRDEIEDLRQRIADGQLSLAEDKLAELQNQLQNKAVELQRARDDAAREFNQRQQKAFQQIERQLMPIIRQVGSEGGYMMIFNKFESGLVYATDEIDITAQVIERIEAAQAAASEGS